jgi:hypothetical protein
MIRAATLGSGGPNSCATSVSEFAQEALELYRCKRSEVQIGDPMVIERPVEGGPCSSLRFAPLRQV